MKSVALVLGTAAMFAMGSVMACPYMDKVTKEMKTYTGEELTEGQSPVLPQDQKVIIVDTKKPTTDSAN